MYKLDTHTKKDKQKQQQNTNEIASTSIGIDASTSVSGSQLTSNEMHNRISWHTIPRRNKNKATEVEDQVRKSNKTHVASNWNITLDKCNSNISVTNDKPLNVCKVNVDILCVSRAIVLSW